MLDKVTFDEQVNVLEIFYIIHIYKILIALFPKLKVLKGRTSRSAMCC